MVVTDYNEQFLDKRGTDHLIDELKAYADSIANGNIDLSDYVTKSELQAKLDALHINIDLSSYATKEELTQAINSIDLSSYALKTEIPSLDGYATTEYVDNAVANIPSSGGGNVDLSNYYTKDETYSKEEVDTAISNIETGGGNTSSDSCALYDTVVANGGAVKETIVTEKPVGTNLSEIISDVANGKKVNGELDNNGTERLHVMKNTDKTQEELNAEFVLPNDPNGRLDFLLASSFQPEEILSLNLKDRLKSGERMYYIIASEYLDKYKFFYGKVYYNRRATQGYLANTCYNELYEIPDNAKLDLLEGMKNMKYICSGTYYNGGLSAKSDNDSYSPSNWLRFKKYIPTGTEYTYTSIPDANGNVHYHTISENISSPEFSAHLLDTYLSNCNKTIKISEAVNYTLAEWGEKLDNTQGEDGVDGVSPTVSITETDNGHTVSITDVNGTQSFDVTNGSNGTNGIDGTNGISPTVTVTKEGKVATITCTDVNGTTTATISDGADGSGGGSSTGGASGITYAYDTEIATGKTWVDGKPIYLKVFHIDPLSSQPSRDYDKRTCCQQDKFADEIISVMPRWKRIDTTETYTGNTFPLVSGAMSASTASDAVSNVNTALFQRLLWCCTYNNTDFQIIVLRGKVMYKYSCDVFVEYTKSA